MHEAFRNGLSGVRWKEAPLGPEAIRPVRRLRERGYAGRTCRDNGHAVVHLGRYLHEERESDRGSKTSEPPKVMLSSVQSAILLTPAHRHHDKEGHRARSHNSQLHITVVLGGEPLDERADLGADRRPSCPVPIRPVAGDQAAVPAQDGTWRDQPVHSRPCWQKPGQRGEDRPIPQSNCGRGCARRSTTTSCRSTSNSVSLDADDRPSRTSQPQSRTKMR